MSDYVVSDTNLTAVANAIRAKGGTSAQLEFPADFVSAIAAIPTGGGGASNYVTGTFKGTTTGAKLEIDVPYQGTGYPIALIIYPEGGMIGNETFDQTIQKSAFAMYSLIKEKASIPPTYTGSADERVFVFYRSKNSTTDAAALSVSSSPNVHCYQSNGSPSASPMLGYRGAHIIFNSATKFGVWIQGSSGSGFMANIDYRYHVIYSS